MATAITTAQAEHDEVCGCGDFPHCGALDFPPPTHICHESGNNEAWVCRCGNTPSDDGFYPCNADGKAVEPTPTQWHDNLYLCDRCKCVISPDTLEIVCNNANML
jgi:hypothetical protein